jgi:hypothetical protein
VVVVENCLGDFSFDWVLVQARVSRFTRICTYDRAGYAWSDPGPKPRTFAQINLELDRERKEGQARLALLSTNSKQLVLDCGHSMHLEAPASVAAAIREVVQAVRNHTALTNR